MGAGASPSLPAISCCDFVARDSRARARAILSDSESKCEIQLVVEGEAITSNAIVGLQDGEVVYMESRSSAEF